MGRSSVLRAARQKICAEGLICQSDISLPALPIQKSDYPPSAETIARNRMHFQQIEQAWRSEGKVIGRFGKEGL